MLNNNLSVNNNNNLNVDNIINIGFYNQLRNFEDEMHMPQQFIQMIENDADFILSSQIKCRGMIDKTILRLSRIVLISLLRQIYRNDRIERYKSFVSFYSNGVIDQYTDHMEEIRMVEKEFGAEFCYRFFNILNINRLTRFNLVSLLMKKGGDFNYLSNKSNEDLFELYRKEMR